MDNNWSPQEILHISLKVEENGRRFYEKLEEKAEDEKVKAVWKFLKEQEVKHQSTFKEMIDNAGDYIIKEFGTGEYDAYIKAIASEYVFTADLMQGKAKELCSNAKEAVDFGLHIEKLSILVYTALQEYVLSDKKHILDSIVKEEKKHVVVLNDLKETL